MLFRLRLCIGLLCGVVALAMLATPQSASAEDLTHMVSGVVKHVDKDTKTMVVKTKPTEQNTPLNTPIRQRSRVRKTPAATSRKART